ncbi:MAG: isochorismatase family protein [Solirubrobacterales bacterium]
MSAATAVKGSSAIAVAGSRPYAWPYDGQLTTASLALAVVSGAGSGGEGDERSRESTLAKCSALADKLRERGVTIIWISCSGAALPPKGDGDLVVVAPTANAFLGSSLDLVLRINGIDKLAFAGWPTEVAVHSTLRRANDLGFECIVLEDACTPFDPALQESSISQILMSGGIFGAVGASSALIEAIDLTVAPATVTTLPTVTTLQGGTAR